MPIILRPLVTAGVLTEITMSLADVHASPQALRTFSVEDRLEHGNLTVDEVCALAKRGRTGFYEDVKAGLVLIRKVGRKSIIPGPIAKRYIAGEPMPSRNGKEEGNVPLFVPDLHHAVI